jgi:hypothetical protein
MPDTCPLQVVQKIPPRPRDPPDVSLLLGQVLACLIDLICKHSNYPPRMNESFAAISN